MNEIETRELFKTYKEGLSQCCDIERYDFVFQGSHFMLDDQFEKLSKELYKSITEINTPESLPLLKEFIDFIYYQHMLGVNSPSKYGKKSAKQYLRVYNFLKGHLNYLETKGGQTSNAKQSVEFRKPVLSEYNKPAINTKQVLILMKCFRENNLVNKEITDKALSECFGTLTGYSGEQLRKDYTKLNKDEIQFKPEELDTLKDILIKMSQDLSKLPLK
ncbi:hypothetical protein FBD94_20320 [Pedobacter hiemivivus]|uniref:Uncharacterized protein n=1 Tax=Pedobacter hiemivivus TaxID=2530454 RepID=A0A4U1G338_9SPHI|nr:hypothetical protein [Pedobacter hiemivivus]TKC57624.1 hypothetical protein FBD94_20320 [Pedobacter hiemivivus]